MSDFKLPIPEKIKDQIGGELHKDSKDISKILDIDKAKELTREEVIFPNVFPESVNLYIDELEKTGLNKEIASNSAFNVIASLCGAKTVQLTNTWSEPIIIQTITIASASMKKTATKRAVSFPLYKQQQEDVGAFKNELTNYLSKTKEEQKEDKKPKLGASILSEFSIQAITSEAIGQKYPVWVYKDEIASAIDRKSRSFDQKSQEVFLSFYSGETSNTLTVASNRGIEIAENPFMYSLYGGIQTEKIDLFFDSANIDNGFCTRFCLHVVPTPKVFKKKPVYEVTDVIKDNYLIFINGLISKREDRGFIHFEDGAKDKFFECRDIIEEYEFYENNRAIKAYWGKQCGVLMRFTGIFCIMRGGVFANSEDVEKAYSLVTYHFRHFKEALEISKRGAFHLPQSLEKRRSYLKLINNKEFKSTKDFQTHFEQESGMGRASFFSLKSELEKHDLIRHLDGRRIVCMFV